MSSLLLTTLDTGNTAWMIMATILVLLMSIPGIALFYGGLVRQKNILSILMQTVFIVAVVSLIWVAFGYSWAFSTEYADSGNPLACVIGGFDKCFLHGIGLDAIMPTGIPELTFAMFQCMFAHAILPLKGKRDSGWGYSWVPVLGPLAGAACAAGLYLLVY